MKKIHRFNSKKRQALRCPVCKAQVKTTTSVPTRSGATRTLSSKPGELTECSHCKSMLEYGGLRSNLSVQRAKPERVRAFQELARETPDDMSLAELVDYVKKFRTTPSISSVPVNGIIRFRFHLS